MFVEEPGPAPKLFAPISAQVQLCCTVSKGYIVHWSVNFTGRARLRTNEEGTMRILAQRNVAVEGLRTNTSTLFLDIHQAVSNNQTMVACLAIDSELVKGAVQSRTVEIIFYGMIIINRANAEK